MTLYLVIGHADRISDPEQLNEVLTSYPGMGLLNCLLFAVVSRPLVRALTAVLRGIPLGTPGFLATREASARPALTRALVVPITLAAAAVGVMSSWIHELTWVMDTLAPESGSVSAPPRQLFLLLGGPVVVVCVRSCHHLRHGLPPSARQCPADGVGSRHPRRYSQGHR